MNDIFILAVLVAIVIIANWYDKRLNKRLHKSNPKVELDDFEKATVRLAVVTTMALLIDGNSPNRLRNMPPPPSENELSRNTRKYIIDTVVEELGSRANHFHFR